MSHSGTCISCTDWTEREMKFPIILDNLHAFSQIWGYIQLHQFWASASVEVQKHLVARGIWDFELVSPHENWTMVIIHRKQNLFSFHPINSPLFTTIHHFTDQFTLQSIESTSKKMSVNIKLNGKVKPSNICIFPPLKKRQRKKTQYASWNH